MEYTLDFGSNLIMNCHESVVVNGKEFFRLRGRAGDDQLVVDFELRDEQGNLVAKIAKNNVVHARPGLTVHNQKDFSEVVDSSTGETLARIEEIGPRRVKVTGTFWFDGVRYVLKDDRIETGKGNRISGNTVIGGSAGITFGPHGISLGGLPSPPT